MNLYACLNAAILFSLGLVLLIHTLSNWSNPNKQGVKYSEIIQAILFFIMGYYSLIIISPNSEAQNRYYLIMFWIYFGLVIFFAGLNVFPNYIKSKIDPNYRKDVSYEKFLQHLDEIYSNKSESLKADIMKDLSRKVLHVLQFVLYVFLYDFGENHPETMSEMGLTPTDFRNFILFLMAGFFWIMMMVGDMTRLTNWKYLPKWAWWWYEKSLEPKREAYTLNSATPILLANLIFIHPSIPIQVFFTASFVSCIGDAFASVIGKNFGKHKLKNIGRYPNKSWEGLLAGSISSFLGVFLIMIYLPPVGGSVMMVATLSGIISASIFAIIDLYCVRIADNIMNSILPGLAVWIIIAVF